MKHRNYRNIFISLFSALVISLGYIAIENQPSPLLDDMDFFTKYYISHDTTLAKIDSALFIDVAFDKSSVSYKPYSDSVPSFIVDRKKLLDFLRLIERVDTHKGIFLDITFDKRKKTPYDDSLRIQIMSMHHNGKCAYVVKPDDEDTDVDFDTEYEPVAVQNYYMMTKPNLGYVRHIYKKDKPNALGALSLYNYINRESPIIPQHVLGNIYVCEGDFFHGGIFRNNPILKIPMPTFDKYFRHYFLYEFMDLPKNYSQTNLDIFNINKIIEGKVLFVGDFISDIHSTYAGEMSGSYLTYNAYSALNTHKHVLTWFFLLVMFIIYFLVSLFIMQDWLVKFINLIQKPTTRYLKKLTETNNKYCRLLSVVISVILVLLDLLLSTATFGLLFFFIFLFLYDNYDFMYSTTVPILYFTLLKFVKLTYKSFNKIVIR